jgi:cytoskeletal protein RodZ
MADQWSGGQSGPGERWNVNLPAVIGVVFVFLVGVIVWVVVASASDDDGALPGESVPSIPTSTIPTSTAAPTTTPLPMPSTTLVAPTAPPTTAPATAPPTVPVATAPPTLVAPTAPPTAAPTQPPTTVAQTTLAPAPTTTRPTTTVPASSVDLGVPGHPITQPPCDGGYITVLGSAIGDQATADSMEAVLNQYAGSHYLRTDVTCSSLTPTSNGQPIYVVYYGPFATDREACAARSQGPKDSYVRRLSNDIPPTHTVKCN